MGSSAGDGGASQRKAQEDQRVSAATDAINAMFGKGQGAPIYGAKPQTSRGRGFSLDLPAQVIGYDTAARDKVAADREALYSKIGLDQKAKLTDDLNTDRTKTEREIRFGMARNGLSGGSADIDANSEVLDQYNKGLLKATQNADSTVNSARSADEKTRVNLINSIRSGLDQGSAVSVAQEGMANNAKAAADEANSASLAGFFDSLGSLQRARSYQGALTAAAGTPAATAKKAGASSYGGTVRDF